MVFPVVYVDVPPQVVDEGRQIEIKKVAEELAYRAEYIDTYIGKARSYKWMLLHVANQTEMTDAAFRMFFNYVAHGNEDGTQIFPGHARVAAITKRSAKSTQRARKELDEGGWLITKRQRRGPAVAMAAIPDLIAQEIVKEILKATNLSLLERPLEVPNLSRPAPKLTLVKAQEETLLPVQHQEETEVSSVKNQEETKQASRRDTSVPLPNLTKEPPTRERARRVDHPIWEMNAAQSAEDSRAQKHIWRTEDGGIDISDDLRAKIRSQFPLVSVDSILAVVAGRSNEKDSASHLLKELKVRFGYAQNDAEDRDRRAKEMAAERAAKKPPNAQKFNDKNEQTRRELAAMGVVFTS
jgi:hypothetical protein